MSSESSKDPVLSKKVTFRDSKVTVTIDGAGEVDFFADGIRDEGVFSAVLLFARLYRAAESLKQEFYCSKNEETFSSFFASMKKSP